MKMTIHKEGYLTIGVVFLLMLIINLMIFNLINGVFWLKILLLVLSVLFLMLIVFFFRKPRRRTVPVRGDVYSAADGEVVVIEEVAEDEYFHDQRWQVSVFMSIFNMHMNLFPVGGAVKYFRYHPGKHFFAFLPKSSLMNERTTVVIKTENGAEVLARQIAGCVARRIVTYVKQDQPVKQGEEMGFIKFGSRVDLFLPLDTKIHVSLGQKVKAGETVLATLA